jgi:rRNA processing protein Gar1
MEDPVRSPHDSRGGRTRVEKGSVMTKMTTTAALAGDHVEVIGHRVGDAPRSGEIVEVLGAAPNPHFRVRWEDGHVSLLYPSTDVAIVRQSAPSGARKPRRSTRPA